MRTYTFKATKCNLTYIQHFLEIFCEYLYKYLMLFGSYLQIKKERETH